jgi:hypothetical protein
MPARWQPPDLDEFRPDRFVISNEKVRPLLRGEGERDGHFFHLQSARREGWLARLRAAGFNVRTLADRVRSLPGLRDDIRIGAEGIRELATARERIAAWDPDRLRWRDLPVREQDGRHVVVLRVNEAIRRRRSRTGGEFFITAAERGDRIGLVPVSETDALLHAYGALAVSGQPAVVYFGLADGGYTVASDQALLPAPHREVLDHLADDDAPPWLFGDAEAPFAEQVFDKLHIELRPERTR